MPSVKRVEPKSRTGGLMAGTPQSRLLAGTPQSRTEEFHTPGNWRVRTFSVSGFGSNDLRD